MKSLAFAGGLLGLAALLPAGGWARPITYPGGTTAMVMHDPTMDMTGFDTTLNRNWAIGSSLTHNKEDDVTTLGPTLTRGWRWNFPNSQANVYATGGAGAAQVEEHTRPTTWGGLSADWEDRRWLVQAGSTVQTIPDGPDRLRNTARVGVAPYVAEAGQLHSWLMLQIDHTPGMEDTWSVTPIVRQFWGTNLWEIGISSRGGATLNFMKTF